MKVRSLSRVRLSDPMDCSPPGSSVHGIFQARVLEWGAVAISVYILKYYLVAYIMEYYSAIKKNEIMPFAATWMDPEIITLSKVSQMKTNII